MWVGTGTARACRLLRRRTGSSGGGGLKQRRRTARRTFDDIDERAEMLFLQLHSFRSSSDDVGDVGVWRRRRRPFVDRGRCRCRGRVRRPVARRRRRESSPVPICAAAAGPSASGPGAPSSPVVGARRRTQRACGDRWQRGTFIGI